MKIKLFSPQAIFELGKRSGQEDAIFPAMGAASDLDSLFIVCDGMGGHEKGEVASAAVVDALSEFLFQNTSPEEPMSDELFKEALEFAYQKLDAIDNDDPKKPGTTLTFLYFHRNGCTLAHIGDSRIYHIRPEERKILYRSRDHSVVYDLYLAGEIEYEDMNKQPNKNVITKAMMPGKDYRQFANIVHVTDIKPDDYFYLCTDGMLEEMSDSEIVDILADSTSDDQKRQRLIDATKDNKDNHSAYLIHIDEVTGERRDKNMPDNEAEMMARSIRRVNDEEDTVVQMQNDQTRVAPATQQPYRPQQTQQAPRTQAAQQPRPALEEEHHLTKKEQTKNASRRSLLIPILTTVALLMILAGVYFTCGGKDKEEVKKDPIEDNVEKKDSVKNQRDTMNIAGGETTSTSLPSPSGDLQTQKPEEKKPEEKKPETTPETTSAETNTTSEGVNPPTHQTPEQPATPTPATDNPQPATTTPTPAQETPAPAPGPRSVIPDE